jgi:uncharacterized membrane protein
MWKPIIGENAGIIWRILSEKGEVYLSELRKTTKLSDRDLFLALGWLAREGKVGFDQKNKRISVILIEGKV